MMVTNGLPKFIVHGDKMVYIASFIFGAVPFLLILAGYKFAEFIFG
jgi:hypothetical protein